MNAAEMARIYGYIRASTDKQIASPETQTVLVPCQTLDCTCCVLTATSDDLDSIVESGLKDGVISIKEEAGLAWTN